MHKYFNLVIAAVVLMASPVAHAQTDNVTIKTDLKTILLDLSSKVKKDASSKGLDQAFDEHTSNLFLSWEAEASGDLSKDISILKKGEPISSAKAADRIGKLGVQAHGASLALARTLNDGRLIMPGDLSRLLGAKTFTAGRRAAVALSGMNEAGVLALIWAISHDFQDADSSDRGYQHDLSYEKLTTKGEVCKPCSILLYRRDLSYDALKTITGKDLPAPAWIQMFASDPESWILAANAKDKPAEKDIGYVSIPSWVNNEFLWSLLVGAMIVFYYLNARGKK